MEVISEISTRSIRNRYIIDIVKGWKICDVSQYNQYYKISYFYIYLMSIIFSNELDVLFFDEIAFEDEDDEGSSELFKELVNNSE